MELIDAIRKTDVLAQNAQENCLILANDLRLLFDQKPLPEAVLEQAFSLDMSDLNNLKKLFNSYTSMVDATRTEDFDLCFLVFSKRACLATLIDDHLFFLGGFGLEHKSRFELVKFTKNFYRYE